MSRGALNEQINKLSDNFLGYQMNTTELRLIPYVHYVMVNNKKIDVNKINSEERAILSKWRERSFITDGASEMTVSKEFWDFMSEILWHGYVNSF